MKKTIKKAKPQKKHPVPEYMDDDLKPLAKNLDVLQRHALAEKLERQAHQLRQMQQPNIRFEVNVTVPLRPQVKRALLAYAEQHGASEKFDENEKLMVGARWFLESALPLIETVSERSCQFARYRDAECLSDSVYTEDLIRNAVDAWESKLSED